ncbi:hypothetical protein [Anaeromyxobacter oryzisoli]|uniref:hypothetical protein n=1 Tax=Anaeromyxobacter oryzisoli TaxID=2925408 RepID=UPI001F5ABB30|nr:hypothetical protein [Anaeromyxobacter sp. SG63]
MNLNETETEITETEPAESARDITERAFDELAGGDETAEAPQEHAEPEPRGEEEGAEERPGRSRDESGRFAKEKPQPRAKPAAAPAAKPAPGQAAPALRQPQQAAAAAPGARAPQSWKPALREKFASLPPDVQEEIARVNRETTRVLQENAQLRQSGGAFQEALRPYEAQIRAAGAEPVAYVGSLLQTAHALTYAPPHQKADLLATLVMQFGPDLLRPDSQDANGNLSSPLDRALVARMSGRAAPGPQQQPQQFRDPRVDQLLAQAQERQRREATEQVAAAEDRAGSFAQSHEFYDDVATQMADVLDVWARQGKREVTDQDLEQAYHLACQMNPDVSPVYEQRRAAQAAAKARASTQRTRAAAASIRSAPAVEAPRNTGKLSPRQITERVFEELEGRV